MTGCEVLPPLLGHLIALTGHRRMDELAGHLQALGATVARGQFLQTRPIGNEQGRLRAATRLVVARPPNFLVATTGIGIRGWLHASASYGERGRLLHALRETKILARGPKVVGALSEAGLRPWVVDPGGRTDALVDLLAEQELDGAHVAFQLPGSAMDDEVERLRARGAWVTPLAVYDWTWPDDLGPARRLLRTIVERRASAVAFTSRPAVLNLAALAREEGNDAQVAAALRSAVVPVCIGSATADALHACFGATSIVPEQPLLGAIVEATVDALHRDGHHHIEVPTGEIIVQRRLVVGPDGSVMTSDREAQLLSRLLATPHRTLHRDELLSAVWWDEVVDPSVLETTVARLRRRLTKTGLTVRTINGRGYLLNGEPRPCPRAIVPLTSSA